MSSYSVELSQQEARHEERQTRTHDRLLQELSRLCCLRRVCELADKTVVTLYKAIVDRCIAEAGVIFAILQSDET